MTTPAIRQATHDDNGAVARILMPVIAAGETHALRRGMTEAEALCYWWGAGHSAFVAEMDGRAVVGTYYPKANQPGGGPHVANCGYMTAAWATGRGVAGPCAYIL